MNRLMKAALPLGLLMVAWGNYAAGDNTEGQTAATTSPLVRAAAEGDLDAVTYLISSGTNVNAADNQGSLPLLAAIAGHHVDVEQYLLANGADPNAAGASGRPVESAILGHPYSPKTLETLNPLLARNVELNFGVHGSKELLLCAVLDDAANQGVPKDEMDNLVVLLMQHGANGSSPKAQGCDTFNKVVDHQYTGALHYLLTHGTDANTPLSSGETLLDMAITGGDLDFLKQLLSSGADVNAPDPKGITPLQRSLSQTNANSAPLTQYLLAHGAHVDAASQGKLLEQSLSAGNFTQAAALLSTVTDVSTVQVAGEPLLLAILDSGGHYVPLLQYLSPGQADVLARSDQNGATLTKTSACLSYDPQLLQFLVSHGDSGLSVSRRAWMLVALVNCHHIDTVGFLLSHGYDVNTLSGTTGTPDSPLCAAADLGAADEVESLLQSGADVNKPDSAGDPPLNCAIDSAHPTLAVVQSLVNHGADFNVSIGGSTPLARALSAEDTGENKAIADYLQSVGATK